MLRVSEYFAKSLKVIRNNIHSICLYLVPFLRYSASINSVTLKSGLGVVQGH